MRDRVFRIKGMDCGEEIAILKREIGPLVSGEEHLRFDLLERKMTISQAAPIVSDKAIMDAVANAGMEAVPWTDECSVDSCPVEEGVWRRHGRLMTCVASGLFMMTGLLLRSLHHGSLVEALAESGHGGMPFHLDALLFYVLAVAAGGWFVAPKALLAARKLRPDMNLLMAVAVLGAMGIGYWLEAASVTFLFSLALLLETWSMDRARQAINKLVDITPTTARCVSPEDGGIEEKPVAQVAVGETVLVRPGEKIPVDGVLTKGTTSVNQSPITGESKPVPKGVGDEVFAGTINGDGSIELRSSKAANDTTLARILHMVKDAQSRRAPMEQWVDKFARIYTPAMMILAFSVAVVPPLLLGGDWGKWFYQALVLLVIACPCSLVISTPVSIVAGLTSAARNGVLIKGGVYLEAPSRLQVIAFDKTGTLTYGRPSVQSIHPTDDHTEDGILARAAALEAHSTHPLARAVLSLADSRGLVPPAVEDFKILPGLGAQGKIQNQLYWVGSHRLLEQWDHESAEFHEMANRMEDAGHSLVIMWCDDHVCGLIGVEDQLRSEAKSAIQSLRRQGIKRVVMLSGDNRKTAEAVASATGIDEYWAELLPADKMRVVSRLKETHGQVAVVGDGVNDAPAMAEASLGIAMGAMGSDAAIETADIALMSDDLSKLPWLIAHSRRTLRTIKQNIVFSLGIKALFIVLSLSGMATLWGAIAADMGASLLVIFNGLRLLNIANEHGPDSPLAHSR